MIIDVDRTWRGWLIEPIPEARCLEGWRALIDDTIVAFGTVMQAGGCLQILELKEKFGGLRIYVRPLRTNSLQNDRISAIGRAAEERSFHICEVCGRPGELWNEGGWYATSCTEHARGSSRRGEGP